MQTLYDCVPRGVPHSYPMVSPYPPAPKAAQVKGKKKKAPAKKKPVTKQAKKKAATKKKKATELKKKKNSSTCVANGKLMPASVFPNMTVFPKKGYIMIQGSEPPYYPKMFWKKELGQMRTYAAKFLNFTAWNYLGNSITQEFVQQLAAYETELAAKKAAKAIVQATKSEGGDNKRGRFDAY